MSVTKVEIITSREVPLGGPRAMSVHRTLPQRQRSLIGAWCFLDHYGPNDVSVSSGMDVAPHPHTGLQTVSWLFQGAITHHDSGGNHAVVVPGEVNLMTSGAGICHSEVSTTDTKVLHGVQLWTVLPESNRDGPRRFDHHAPERISFDGGSALVFLGSLLGYTSPVPTFTPLVGAELSLLPGASISIEVDPAFEHGLLIDAGSIVLEGISLAPTELAYTGIGEQRLNIHNNGSETARMILIGGEPFTEPIIMWWNFIGRSFEEIERYRAQWQAGDKRFGQTLGYIGHQPQGPTWLPAPGLPNARITPRTNPAPIARPELRI
ncbi:pirin family protein [Corynebacterium alimapuense]|uniref:Pirin n=1 Tax=Corynebacterium alimapuense TaxID=1576874 RepID=A0A3M8K8S2_9CORY|nr:pirin family protein [Corynebacterium alimapuense]RNE49637.1 pirin [Corynebacterium alimapuense]